MFQTQVDTSAMFFFENSSDLFAVFDIDGAIIGYNPAWCTMAGYCDEQIRNLSVFSLVHEHSTDGFMAQLTLCRQAHKGYTYSHRICHGDNQFAWYSCYIRFDQEQQLYYGLFQNITEQVRATHEIVQREERLKILVDNVNEYLYSVQFVEGAFVGTFHNKQCKKITGYTAEEFEKDPDLWYTMIHEDDRQLVVDNLESIKKNKRSFYIEHRIIHKSGPVRWISNSCVAVVNEYEQKFQYIGFILDITDKKSREHELYDHAIHDALTGIYNRWAGIEALQRSITKSRRSEIPCTVCYCDINNLKEVNDRLGHSYGDSMIKNAVKIIQQELRTSDLFFRIGGDEFVLVFADTALEYARKIIQRITMSVDMFNGTGNRPFQLFISFGLAEYDPDAGIAMTAEQLIIEADKRMYHCKEKSRKVFRSAVRDGR